jgi:FdhD protein
MAANVQRKRHALLVHTDRELRRQCIHFEAQKNSYKRASAISPEGRCFIGAPVARFTGEELEIVADMLAVEEPLEIQLVYGAASNRQTKSISVMMRTPRNDFELAAGFLMTKRVVRNSTDIAHIRYFVGRSPDEQPVPATLQLEAREILPYQPERNVVAVELEPDVEVKLANLERNFYTTSSCGICGKASLLALRTVCPPRASNRFTFRSKLLYTLSSKLRNAQLVFERTGGLHAAGLFDQAGELLSSSEDVGRHNAVDKLLGAEFVADRVPLRNCLLFLSGRASFELLQKALMGDIPMVVAVGAPSSLAVQVAKEFNVMLVGFLRADHFNVYHGTEHLITDGTLSGGTE